MPPRVYLDNAATSWPKPDAVYAAVDHYQRELGAAAGRGVYREAIEVERLIEACRRRVAKLVNAARPEQIVFTQNGTDALNLALHGLLRPGDHVVTTTLEHNSVLRPLRALAERDVTATYVACDPCRGVDPDDIAAAITSQTKLIAINHVSNVTGVIQPVAEIGRLARDRGIKLLVDAAQSAGCLDLDLQQLGADLLAVPGHKGCYGPLGTGFLALAPGMEEILQPIRQGGTGTRSDEDVQPTSLPDRYEAGNLNVPGLVGLEAGLTFVAEQTPAAIHAREVALITRLIDQLVDVAGLELFAAPPERRAGLVSLRVANLDPREVAAILDATYGVQVRAGLHCAPRCHAALHTTPEGTARLSVGAFTTEAQIDLAAKALAEIAAEVA